MGYPLTDITIYYGGKDIKVENRHSEFRRTVNFVSDQYHRYLNGYKPPKTSRITITFTPEKLRTEPWHFGSICSYDCLFNEKKYLQLNQEEKYLFILELLHRSCLEIGNYFNWETSFFVESYQKIKNNNFNFILETPEKLSRDRKKIGQAIIEKNRDYSILKVRVDSNDESRTIELLQNENWFFYDPIYDFAKKCKWIDKNSFGILSKDGNNYSFYCIDEQKVKSNMGLRK